MHFLGNVQYIQVSVPSHFYNMLVYFAVRITVKSVAANRKKFMLNECALFKI